MGPASCRAATSSAGGMRRDRGFLGASLVGLRRAIDQSPAPAAIRCSVVWNSGVRAMS